MPQQQYRVRIRSRRQCAIHPGTPVHAHAKMCGHCGTYYSPFNERICADRCPGDGGNHGWRCDED